MVIRNNGTRALTAGSATIIFIAYLIAQLLYWACLEAVSLLNWSEDIFSPMIGGLVMVSLAVILIPKNLKEVGPNGAAWVLGPLRNLFKGLTIGCIIGVGSLSWDTFSSPHFSYGTEFVGPTSRMLVTPGAQQITLTFVALVLLGPAVEEMMFRGVLYGGYRKSFGPLCAAMITTAIFVAMHYPAYIHFPLGIVPYVLGSLALIWCRLHWKAIGPSVAAHSGINVVIILVPSLVLTWRHAFYESGLADYKESKFNQAIVSLTHAIRLGDDSANVYVYRGLARYAEGDLDGAISDYGKGIELNPKDSAGFYDRGLAKRRKEDFEGAIADYDEAIALHPWNFEAYNERGLARVSQGQPEAAISDFDVAIELNPTNSMYYNDRGWAEYLKGDFDPSIADATRSIQLNPKLGYAYGTRGWARFRKEDFSGAVEDCHRATQLFKKGSSSFLHDQGLLDFIAKDYKKAAADWQNAIEQEPELKKELQSCIEEAQDKAGLNTPIAPEVPGLKPKGDRSSSEPSHSDKPPDETSGYVLGGAIDTSDLHQLARNFYDRGDAQRKAGNLEAALTNYDIAIETDQKFAEAYAARGYVEQVQNSVHRALSDYNKAIGLKPDYAYAYLYRGCIEKNGGNLAAALLDYDKAIELKPSWAIAYCFRGKLEAAACDLEPAEVDSAEAAKLDPNLNTNISTAFITLGWSRYQRQEYKNALSDFREVSGLDPTNDYPHLAAWLCRSRLGEIAPAIDELKGYLATRNVENPDDWPLKIGAFLSSQITEEKLLNAADSVDAKKNADQHCEAYFYIGSKRLIAGDKGGAVDYFNKCVATGVQNFAEYQCAKAELKNLGGVTE